MLCALPLNRPPMPALILPAPLWRRLAAAFYDSLLLIAIWMALTLLMTVGASYVSGAPAPPSLLRSVLLTAALLYFVRSWTRGGQTLGMKTWQLQLRRSQESPLTLTRASLRFALAWISWGALGLGVLWCLVDPRRRAWHDILTDTEVVVLPKSQD